MSYGDITYGEISYGEILDSGTDVISESVSETFNLGDLLSSNWVNNSPIDDNLTLNDLPSIYIYDLLVDLFNVDDIPDTSVSVLILEIINLISTLDSGLTDSRNISENVGVNDFLGFLEYINNLFSLSDLSIDNRRILGFALEIYSLSDKAIISHNQSLIDIFHFFDTTNYRILGEIVESFNTSDILQSNGNLKVVVVDNLENNDRLIIGLPTLVADSLNLNDTSVGIRKQLVSVLNNLVVDGTLTSVGSFITHQGDAVNIVDAIGTAAFEALVASLTSSDNLSVRLVMSLGLSSSMGLSEAATEYLDRFIEAVSDLILNDENSTQTDGVVSVLEEINISHFFDPANMQTWLMNPENYAVYNYSFQFNQATNYNNDLLMADDTGLFVLEGDNDNGENIVSVITTSAMNFGAESLKQVPSVLLGTNGTDLVLKVSIDGKDAVHYSINNLPAYLGTKRIKIGKGLIGNNWQFTLITNNNSKFDLDSFEFYPIVLKRKHNG